VLLVVVGCCWLLLVVVGCLINSIDVVVLFVLFWGLFLRMYFFLTLFSCFLSCFFLVFFPTDCLLLVELIRTLSVVLECGMSQRHEIVGMSSVLLDIICSLRYVNHFFYSMLLLLMFEEGLEYFGTRVTHTSKCFFFFVFMFEHHTTTTTNAGTMLTPRSVAVCCTVCPGSC
jgi:hypothetical protein